MCMHSLYSGHFMLSVCLRSDYDQSHEVRRRIFRHGVSLMLIQLEDVKPLIFWDFKYNRTSLGQLVGQDLRVLLYLTSPKARPAHLQTLRKPSQLPDNP